eukprot:TRINITY_DN5320_c0_g1_i2.p1 TRINITY_DN5320_c0_g1~~TRINITY_DN5320_c0_g1_i2.p1  ORF type:complete len:302 (+),score=43.55 TRINITY_DN5320_c0_g1_i2:59-964(+)
MRTFFLFLVRTPDAQPFAMDIEQSLIHFDTDDMLHNNGVSVAPRDASSVNGDVNEPPREGIGLDLSFLLGFEPLLGDAVGCPALDEIPLPFGLAGAKINFPTQDFRLSKLQHGDERAEKAVPPSQAPRGPLLQPICVEPSSDGSSECSSFGASLDSFSRYDEASQLDTCFPAGFQEAWLCVLSTKRSGKSLQRQYHKTKLCGYYARNRCYLGDECLYAHSTDELQELPSLKKTKLCDDFLRQQCFKKDCDFAHGYNELRSTEAMYKTTFCRWFARNACRAGSKCRYAHSIAELRAEAHQQQ